MTGADALHNTLDLARRCDELGYHSYWLAEHHGTPMLAGPAPEVMIGPVAAATNRIRVGSGGGVLPPHSPLQGAPAVSAPARPYPDPPHPPVGPARGTPPPPPPA